MSGFDYDAASARIANEFKTMAAKNEAPAVAPTPKGEGFKSVLGNLLNETDALQQEADKAVEQLMTGEKQDVQGVMLQMAKADMSFRMMIEVRNKLVEAYQEVMRMQV